MFADGASKKSEENDWIYSNRLNNKQLVSLDWLCHE